MRYLPSPIELRGLGTDQLRAAFLVEDLFIPDEIILRAIDLDRVILGGAVPTSGPLPLQATALMAADYFTERRELGVLNIGGQGSVGVAGARYELAKDELLYIGRGHRDVVFASEAAAHPACFYLVSYPAHTSFPVTRVTRAEADSEQLGSAERANLRYLSRYVHPGGPASAQLVMGVTSMRPGSVWNTMPPHTHQRRTEVYLYYDLPDDAVVFHFLGEPTETRSLVVRNRQVAVSPGWSIHAGCGTASYSFCWAMGGENQVFADMQAVNMGALR
jgi:4-deoxy-L-threo-5-hexosulose-uronate ketol-isomerase